MGEYTPKVKYIHIKRQKMIPSLRSMFRLLMLDLRFPLLHIETTIIRKIFETNSGSYAK